MIERIRERNGQRIGTGVTRRRPIRQPAEAALRLAMEPVTVIVAQPLAPPPP